MGETTTVVVSQEDADYTSFTKKESSIIDELETALGGILHIRDAQEGVQNNVSTSEGDEICLQEKDKMSQLLDIHLMSDCSTKTHGSLTKYATFPSSGKTQSSALVERNEVPGVALHGESYPKFENTCTRSKSLPTPLRLVSAMKGGRERQGTPWQEKLNVTWAPDVYDPPTTSLSHTVKNHHQRPKSSKRKDQKHKHKGKYARGSSSERSERKHHVNRRSISNTDLVKLRSQSSGNNRSSAPMDGFDHQLTAEVIPSVASTSKGLLTLDGFEFDRESEVVSGIKVAELAVGSRDKKCGSSFRSHLAQVHVSIAEAT